MEDEDSAGRDMAEVRLRLGALPGALLFALPRALGEVGAGLHPGAHNLAVQRGAPAVVMRRREESLVDLAALEERRPLPLPPEDVEQGVVDVLDPEMGLQTEVVLVLPRRGLAADVDVDLRIAQKGARAGDELPNEERVPRVVAIPGLFGITDHLIPHAGFPRRLGDPGAGFLGIRDVELIERVAALEKGVPGVEDLSELAIEDRVVEQREAGLRGHRDRQKAVHRRAHLGRVVEGRGGGDDLIEDLEEAIEPFDPEHVAVVLDLLPGRLVEAPDEGIGLVDHGGEPHAVDAVGDYPALEVLHDRLHRRERASLPFCRNEVAQRDEKLRRRPHAVGDPEAHLDGTGLLEGKQFGLGTGARLGLGTGARLRHGSSLFVQVEVGETVLAWF